jgi:hypothetical protein
MPGRLAARVLPHSAALHLDPNRAEIGVGRVPRQLPDRGAWHTALNNGRPVRRSARSRRCCAHPVSRLEVATAGLGSPCCALLTSPRVGASRGGFD